MKSISQLINERRKIKENKKLIKEFPFLLPRNRFSGEVSKDYDYTYTELDSMPSGWRKAFGLQMCEEIKQELIKYNYLDDYRVMDIKEKYGILCWYDNGQPAKSNVDKIISRYEDLSMCYCINCGKPVRFVTKGWIEYICEDCKKDLIENFHRTEDSFVKINEEYIPERCTYIDGIEKNWKTGVDFKKHWGLK